jgi:hypothetical protein
MVTGHDVERWGQLTVGCGDDQTVPHPVADSPHGASGHEGCRFADRQQTKRSVGRRVAR